MARIVTHPGYLAGLDAIKGMSAWEIVDAAEVDRPDHSASPGAEFVRDLRDDLVTNLDHLDDPVDWLVDGRDAADDYASLRSGQMVGEIVRDHERWQVFVDLCAYDSDYEDYLGEEPVSLDDQRDIALSVTAARVMRALNEVIRSHIRENEDDDPFSMFRVDSDEGVLTATCIDDGWVSPGQRTMNALQDLTDDHLNTVEHP